MTRLSTSQGQVNVAPLTYSTSSARDQLPFLVIRVDDLPTPRRGRGALTVANRYPYSRVNPRNAASCVA
jgi:hypothetical protein